MSDTRWSARVDAVSALRESYGEIKKALIKVSESETERPSTKLEANSLAKKFDKHEIAFMTILWDRILRRMDKVSKFLQKKNINLKMAINQIHSLRLFFEEVRDDYSGIEAEVLALSSSILRSDDGKNKRKRKRKRFPDENVDGEIQLEGTEKVRVEILNVICDSLIVELEKRKEKLEYVSNVFKEVFVDEPPNSPKTNTSSISKVYMNDIHGKQFTDELKHFRHFLSVMGQDQHSAEPEKWYKLLVNSDGLKETFPNVETILKIFLTLPVSNASGERSFSALKRVKNYLRSTLSQVRLNNLAILYIECNSLSSVNYDEVIDNFAAAKARRKFL